MNGGENMSDIKQGVPGQQAVTPPPPPAQNQYLLQGRRKPSRGLHRASASMPNFSPSSGAIDSRGNSGLPSSINMQHNEQSEDFLSSQPVLNSQTQQHAAQVAAAQMQAMSNLQTQQLLQMQNPQILHQMIQQLLYAQNGQAAQQSASSTPPGAYSHCIGNTAAAPLPTVKIAPGSLSSLVAIKKGRFSVLAPTDGSSSPSVPKTSVGTVGNVPAIPTMSSDAPYTSGGETPLARTPDPNQQNVALSQIGPSDSFSCVHLGDRQAQTLNCAPWLPTTIQTGVGGQGNLSSLTSASVTHQVPNLNLSVQPVLNMKQNSFSPAQYQQVQHQPIPPGIAFHHSSTPAVVQPPGAVHQTSHVPLSSNSMLGMPIPGGSVPSNTPITLLPHPVTTKKGRFILTSTTLGDIGSQTCPPQGNLLGSSQLPGGPVHSGHCSNSMGNVAHSQSNCITGAGSDIFQLQRAYSMPRQHQGMSTDPRVASGIHQQRPPLYVPNGSSTQATAAPEVNIATNGQLQSHSYGSGGSAQSHLSTLASTHSPGDRSGSLVSSVPKPVGVFNAAPSSMGKMFHYLEQLKLEMTDADKAMKCLQNDVKFLRSKNKELETKCNESEKRYAEEKIIREAAESKVRALKKRMKELKDAAPSDTGAIFSADSDVVSDITNEAPVPVEGHGLKFSPSLVASDPLLLEQPDALTIPSSQFLPSSEKYNNYITAKSLFANNDANASNVERQSDIAKLPEANYALNNNTYLKKSLEEASLCQAHARPEQTMAKTNLHNNSTTQIPPPSIAIHANISASDFGTAAVQKDTLVFSLPNVDTGNILPGQQQFDPPPAWASNESMMELGRVTTASTSTLEKPPSATLSTLSRSTSLDVPVQDTSVRTDHPFLQVDPLRNPAATAFSENLNTLSSKTTAFISNSSNQVNPSSGTDT